MPVHVPATQGARVSTGMQLTCFAIMCHGVKTQQICGNVFGNYERKCYTETTVPTC